MDIDDFEDMLFSDQASQACLHADLDDEFEDKLLFTHTEDDTSLWKEQDSQVRVSPTIESQVDMHTTKEAQKPPHDRNWIITRIESMLERIVDSLLEEDRSLTITLKSRAALSRRRTTNIDEYGQIPEAKTRDISFPGASAQEAWNFTVLLRILELVHGSLIDNTIMTKRDLYYRHAKLFVKQSVVDRYVDDLACTLGVTRSQLNVTATAKGLVAGNFNIIQEHGHRVECMKEKDGMLVPKIADNDILDLKAVQWILVIEKEATFRSILSCSQWETLGSNGIVLTAKGYPDLASRKFLRLLVDHAPHIPVYALMDLDPDGIAILATYQYGSYRLAHEAAGVPNETPSLSLPNIHWLGVKSHHISRTPVDESDTDTNVMPELQGLMKLTVRDRTRAARMLEWDLCTEDGPEQGWRQELQMMLVLNIKAEMQILDELPCGLVSWVCTELGKAVEQTCRQPMDSNGSDDGMLF